MDLLARVTPQAKTATTAKAKAQGRGKGKGKQSSASQEDVSVAMRRLLWAHELELNALRQSLVLLVLVKDEALKGQLAEVRRVWLEKHGSAKSEKLTEDGAQQMSVDSKSSANRSAPHENLKVLTHSWCLDIMRGWSFSQSAQLAYDA
eukprot:4291894-Amphidinium_carterae.1